MAEPAGVACSRTYPAPVALVFRAFTDPSLMRRWWSPDPTVALDVLDWDLVVGGGWRSAYRFPEGQVIHVRGVFRTIEPDRRLGFTWTWEPPDPHAGIETVVSVTFEGAAAGTTVRVHHEGFPDDPSRTRHDAGWASTLDRLTEVLR
jgi:uncharacterized protein YndB with AHSA1/START domain